MFFSNFLADGQICLKWTQMGPGTVSPADPDLADILGDTDVDFENLYFLDVVGSQISGFPDSWIPRFKAVI